MQKLLNDLSKAYQSDDDFKMKMDGFQRALKSEEWRFFITLAMAMKNHMAVDMFTAQYTKLTAEEKDIRQRTYSNINEILDFFMNPLRYFQKKSKFSMVSKRFMPDLQKKKGESAK
jgi:hypothetical protein